MKYKTLIEKNFETILTEGALTPPHPRFASTTLPRPPPPVSRYRLPTRQRCIYAGQEDRLSLKLIAGRLK